MKKIVLDIEEMDYEGRGIGYVNNSKFHVYYAVPGDKVEVQVLYKKRGEYYAKVKKVLRKSPYRMDPICEYFSRCGGCRFQNLKYEKQLEFKQTVVEKLFGKCNKIIPSVDEFFYRNKMDFIVGSGYKIGLREVERFDRIVDIRKCYLQSDYSNNVINTVREYLRRNNIEPYDIIRKRGSVRYIIIREGKNTGEKMVNIVTTSNLDKTKLEGLKEILKYDSFIWSINDSISDVSTAEKYYVVDGSPYIKEKLLHREFIVSPYSFFQTNTKTAETMYKKIIEMLDLKGKERVLDLYCGSGIIGIFLAEYAEEVTGVDISQESINIAKQHAKDLRNIKFINCKAEDIKKGEFDVIVVDPPRAGLTKRVIENILKLNPNYILYVSCNPRTQKRDILLLSKRYTPVEIQPIDMFPQTYHIENIVLLKKI